MLQRFFTDGKIWFLLFAFDEDLAEKAKLARCPFCGAPLHQAHFQRKPRGGAQDLDDLHNCRFSFCCYQCRKRLTPPSFRFFGRKVYFGAIFLLVSAMLGGASPERRRRLHEICGADARTLGRWKKWWAKVFAQSSFWRDVSARFTFKHDFLGSLPRLLIKSLKGSSFLETMVGVLRLLLPMTTGRGLMIAIFPGR